MSIESLKEAARRHEQKEEWRKALDQYKKAIDRLERDDQPDIGLYNRVGDLFVRVMDLDSAVEHYDRAVDLYVESGLHNNAIAVCKKIVRSIPMRHQVYLRMGQIRADQGFLPDARTSFLTYAERMQQAGDLDESFRALVEFCDLAPDEVELRVAVGEQMATHDRVDEAVFQLLLAYHAFAASEAEERADEVRARIVELDPDADFTAPAPTDAAEDEDAFEVAPTFEGVEATPPAGTMDGFETTTLAEEASSEVHEEVAEVGADAPSEAEAAEDEVVQATSDDLGWSDDEAEVEEPAEEAEAVATEWDDEDAEGVVDLPLIEVPEDDAEPVEELPLIAMDADEDLVAIAPDEDDEEVDEAEAFEPELVEVAPDEPAGVSVTADTERLDLGAVHEALEASPDDVALHQRMVELAYQSGEGEKIVSAFLGLAGALGRTGDELRARVAYEQVLQLDPRNAEAAAALGTGAEPEAEPVQEVAAHDDYVDLGSLILSDDDERTTRFVVAYEEPTGDEDADFANMLSQFKAKVSENLDAGDVRAHHDLGTAYKEMGLLDEAVAEFQQALRASARHLPTYELLGQTFMDMGNAQAAVRTLERALETSHEVEDELVGIYYHLGRAYQEVGNEESALEFFDRVFALDINFADVTDRLRELR